MFGVGGGFSREVRSSARSDLQENLAGAEGIKPSFLVLETKVLSLDDAPKKWRQLASLLLAIALKLTKLTLFAK